MAGDFVMVQFTTPRKPQIHEVARALGIHPLHAMGLCILAWMWFDEQTEDGRARRATFVTLDAIVGHTGFAKALADVGWLSQDGPDLVVPDFERHMGDSMKKRERQNARQRKSRKKRELAESESVTNVTPKRDTVTKPSQRKRDQIVTKEKKREENKEERESTGLRAGGEDENAPLPEVPNELAEIWDQWLRYKSERKEQYHPTGLRAAISHVRNMAAEVGVAEVKRRMMKAMASNYKGWDSDHGYAPPRESRKEQRRPVTSISKPEGSA